MPVLLVDQELGSTCIAVVHRLGKPDSIVEDGIAGLDGQVLRRGKLDDLLMATLDTAVALVQMHDVAEIVTEQLDLDVLGLVEEALDEDGAVAEGRLGLGGRALERVLEGGLLADDSHTTTATTEGGLDDDREAILVGEALDFLEPLDGAGRARHHGHVALDSELSRRDLVAESVDSIWGRSYELLPKVSPHRKKQVPG